MHFLGRRVTPVGLYQSLIQTEALSSCVLRLDVSVKTSCNGKIGSNLSHSDIPTLALSDDHLKAKLKLHGPISRLFRVVRTTPVTTALAGLYSAPRPELGPP